MSKKTNKDFNNFIDKSCHKDMKFEDIKSKIVYDSKPQTKRRSHKLIGILSACFSFIAICLIVFPTVIHFSSTNSGFSSHGDTDEQMPVPPEDVGTSEPSYEDPEAGEPDHGLDIEINAELESLSDLIFVIKPIQILNTRIINEEIYTEYKCTPISLIKDNPLRPTSFFLKGDTTNEFDKNAANLQYMELNKYYLIYAKQVEDVFITTTFKDSLVYLPEWH